MKKNTMIVMCLAIACLLLSGCSDKNSKKESSTANTSITTETVTEQALKEEVAGFVPPPQLNAGAVTKIKFDDLVKEIENNFKIFGHSDTMGGWSGSDYVAQLDGSTIRVNKDDEGLVRNIQMVLPFFTMYGFDEAAELIHMIYPEKGSEIETKMWEFETQLNDSSQAVDSMMLLHGGSDITFMYEPSNILPDVYITIGNLNK